MQPYKATQEVLYRALAGEKLGILSSDLHWPLEAKLKILTTKQLDLLQNHWAGCCPGPRYTSKLTFE